MLLKPIDEQTTRHLFSTGACEKITGLSFIQSITDPQGKIVNSPDGWLIDKRTPKYKLLKCEFKFMPCGWQDYKHNGQFDISVVWDIHPSTTKEKLLNNLVLRNECTEIIVLREYRELNLLPTFKIEEAINVGQLMIIDELERLLLKKAKETAYISYIAARIYPNNFVMGKIIKLLVRNFRSAEQTQPKGRAGIVTALIQTKPQLIKHMFGKEYKWNNEIDAKLAIAKISELLINNFEIQPPTEEDLEYVQGKLS